MAKKDIRLAVTYRGDLTKLKDDVASLKSIRRQLESTPVKLRVRLDLTNLRSDAVKAAHAYQAELTKAMGAIRPGTGTSAGGGVSKGGILIPPGAMAELKNFREASGRELKTIEKTFENSQAKVVKSFEQLQRGLARETTISTDKKGRTSKATSIIDTRPIEAFKRAMEDIDSRFGPQLGAARGNKGDVASILAEKKKAIDSRLTEFADLEGSPEYQRARKSMIRLDQTLSQTGASQNSRLATEARKSSISSMKAELGRVQQDFAQRLGSTKGGKGDVETVLREKRDRIASVLKSYDSLNNTPAYRSAQNALAGLEQLTAQAGAGQSRAAREKADKYAKQAATEAKRNFKTHAERTIHKQDRWLQSDLKINKGDEAAAKAIQNRIVREQELNRVLNERESLIARQQQRYQDLASNARKGGHTEAANQFVNAAARMGNDLGQVQLDRKRADHAGARATDDRNLDRLLAQSLRYNEQQRAALMLEEKQARMLTDRWKREQAINNVLARRKALMDDTRNRVTDIHSEAARRGNHGLMTKAETAGGNLHKTAIRDMDRLAEATSRSTHANQFHSSSLIRNAVSFTRWSLAMTAVTLPLAAISSGISNAVKLERTFKTLNAVFRGSREDAALLAEQTLQLAAANGRDGQEAAEAAIAWSRLGLTRTQVLMAMETSLRAANVAEITAAEATGYLTAAYKNFHQTLYDIPLTLDYINSLSNENADRVKDMFNAIARGGKVAGDAGLSLQRFAAISATVGEATQRPGAEFGNASKSIFNRIRKPETLEKLKEDFDLDFTTATSELQGMDQILLKLADTYANLNTTERANLTLLIAGSNQSNRAATMLDTYTDSLVAEAVASADANSAMRENAEILDSVDAGLKSVATSWNSLILSLAELGAFDVASKALSGLAEGLGDVAKGINSIGGLKEGTLGKLGRAQANRMGSSFGLSPVFLYKTIRDAMTGNLLQDKDAKPQQSPAAQILERQAKINSLSASAQAYQAMGRDTFSKDPQRIISSFDKSLPAFKTLPDGERAMFEAQQQIRPLLEQGDMRGAREALAARQEMFEKERAAEIARLDEVRPGMIAGAQSAVQGSRDRLRGLENGKLAAVGDPEQQARLQSEINKTNALLKDQEEVLKAISRQQTIVSLTDPFEEIKGSLTAYMDELRIAGEEYGKVIGGFGNTGFPNLDAKLAIGASRMQGDLFDGALASTRDGYAAERMETERMLALARDKRPNEHLSAEMTTEADDRIITALQEQLALHENIESTLDSEIQKLREASREEERKLEFARQAAQLQESFDDGTNTTRAGNERFAIGRSEGEQLANRTRGSLQGLRDSSSFTGGDPATSARQLGQLTENLSASKEGLLSLEDRMNRALAERANLELEITDQAVKQREEATKRLAVASREDQLRAAAGAAFLRNNGKSGFSMQQFQYFSQETRGAISNLAPQSVKGLDDTERDNAESRNKLDTEINLIATSLASLRKEFENLRPGAENKGGELGGSMRPNVPPPDLSKNDIKLQLSTGEVRINFDMAPHIQSIVTLLGPKIDAGVTAAFAKLKRDVTTGIPDTSPAAAVR